MTWDIKPDQAVQNLPTLKPGADVDGGALLRSLVRTVLVVASGVLGQYLSQVQLTEDQRVELCTHHAAGPTIPCRVLWLTVHLAGDQLLLVLRQNDLSPATRTALGILKDKLDTWPRDWARYTRQAAEFHRRNARARASTAAGEDLAGQIDPEFTLGPNALAMAQA